MAHRYAQIAFTEIVRQLQTELNSRKGYASLDEGEDYNYLLSANEVDFITQRDSFYMASVSETSWPYVQHRGGAKGFVRVLDESTIGFSDFSGNRQYVSTGNFRGNDRVALFFMDYPNRRRLKMMGHIHQVAEDDWELLAKLEVDGYRATVERAFVIKIVAFDWNCPQHITPRFSEQEIDQILTPLIEENKALKLYQEERARDDYPQVLGQGELPLVITGIRQLTPRIRAYELRHCCALPLPEVQAGSHIQTPVQLMSGEMVLRNYSVCSNPARKDIYEIAVLKEPEGQGASVAIHHFFKLGMVLNCAPPQNFFELHTDNRPAVLIAGGIGITPIKSMAQALKSRGTDFTIHYAGKSLNEMAFQQRLQLEFKSDLRVYPADEGKRIDISSILENASNDAIFYCCGPQRLLTQFLSEAKARGIPSERVRFEQFEAELHEGNPPFTVQLAKSNITLEVGQTESLLDAVLDHGIDLTHSCKAGQCKQCAVKVLDGEPLHLDNCLTEDERTRDKLMCPCVSRSDGSQLVLDI